MVYVIQICWQLAVSKPVWHIPLLCLQWKTPDDGQRNSPKHVELYSKNTFEKLVHLVGFIIRNSIEFIPCVFRKNIRNNIKYSNTTVLLFKNCQLQSRFRPSSIHCNTRWFKYDRNWFVCKQAALRSSCATLREWSHNLHPPSCSG